MIVSDRLVRSMAAPASWKSVASAWSIAVLAAAGLLASMSPDVRAQGSGVSAHPGHAAAVVHASGGAGDALAQGAGSGASSTVSAAVAADASAMSDRHTVQKGESLSDIAGELTHSNDRTVKQNMANALFVANPNAFFANNPNRLTAAR